MDDRLFVRKLFSGTFAFVFALSTVLTPIAQAEECVPQVFLKPILSESEEFTNAVWYANLKNKLLRQRLWWSRALGRKVSQGEYNHTKLTSFIRRSIKTERPYIIVDEIRPNAHETLLSYFMVRELKKNLDEVMAQLQNSPNDAALLQKQTQLRKDILRQGTRLGNSYDRYKVAISYLEAIAKNGGDSSEAAKSILAQVDARRLLGPFFERSGIRAQKSPTVAKLAEMLNEFPEFEMKRLRTLRNQEIVATILAISPSQLAYDAIKNFVKKVPGVNEEKLRAFFMAVESSRMKLIYGPDISRISSSRGAVEDRLRLLESLNAETDDELLVTFARRADQKEIWLAMREAAEQRTVKTFFQRMKKAETAAKKLGDLSDEGRSSGFVITRRFLDFVLVSTIGYFAYKKIKGPGEEETPPTTTPAESTTPDPNVEPGEGTEQDPNAEPTEAEEQEMDELADQAQQVIEEIDPRENGR